MLQAIQFEYGVLDAEEHGTTLQRPAPSGREKIVKILFRDALDAAQYIILNTLV